ncbi:Copper amine oxidase N-terminal domain-containing protein [Cohnella sp. OV330]|uniref:copper amine oxidase N-terminal domain-containing protein n=1 Tax=Cohnella sp. OV330 TaxID=1855288 RepID=UPI0008F15058|nr:copper amine oxidase N-terminal domain-containing protein [Cohnella sp. OV330]SFB34690.1 Copper amine oxidase N-terminal domain-containing protein [Cohnella sp. OV330]
MSLKRLFWIVLCLAIGSAALVFADDNADAAEPAGIRTVIDSKTLLLDDGSMWVLAGDRYMLAKGLDLTDVAGSAYYGLALTRNGALAAYTFDAPSLVEGQTDVAQITSGYWLKKDGTVWTEKGKVKGFQDVLHIASKDKDFAALTRDGQVLYINADYGVLNKLGQIDDAESVVSIQTTYDRVALLYDSGEAVIYEGANFDDNGKVIPVLVTDDAVSIQYAGPMSDLLIVRRDGTVWSTGPYSDRFKLTKQVQGLSDIVKTAGASDADNFFAMNRSGRWFRVVDGEPSAFQAPGVSRLSAALSNASPNKGDKLTVGVQLGYTNGSLLKAAPGEASIVVDKPYLLKLQPDGSFVAAGVGETAITVSSGSATKTLQVVIGYPGSLTYAQLSNGTVYLPAKSVLQALGGSFASKDGGYEGAVGARFVQFKVGSASAQLDGNPITLKAAPLMSAGVVYVPSDLLSSAFGVTAKWNATWQQADLSVGKAKLTVVSKQTAALVKKAAQGSLAKYIGKTYWVNHYNEWSRFAKVTVTDVIPDGSGYFKISFKTASGQTWTSYSMPTSFIPQIFSDDYYFLTFDPYKKYKWSNAAWQAIKVGNVTLGMTKDQVQLSWGSPSGKSTTKTSAGQVIETWVYRNFDTVAFVDGKAIWVMD